MRLRTRSQRGTCLALPVPGVCSKLHPITRLGTRGMFSWKAIRTSCAVLLLLPVAHLAYLLSRDTLEVMDSSPDTWSREMASYAADDTLKPLPANPILVVGGRAVKLWHNLEELLAPRPVLLRGLGEAVVQDITFNYTQLIGHYRPDTVVLLPGSSEFHLRDFKSARQLAAAIRNLYELDASHQIWRPQDHATIDEALQYLRAWAKTERRVAILDANPLLSGPDGKPSAFYFRSDGINLNEHGYLRLSVLLYNQVEADSSPPQRMASHP
jgi:hypothetical protein